MDLRHRFVDANGVRFHFAEQGEGTPVVLLHGFPECWYSWRKQLPVIADAGFRAIAPDMRGYNLTDKPHGGYSIETLVEDAVALTRAVAGDGAGAHIVGHDWGGIVAWQLAWRRPEFVRSLAVLNAPHPSAFAAYVRRSPAQMIKSSCMLLFQVPRFPEWLLTRNCASAVVSAFWRSARRRDVFSDADLEVYRQAMLRPGAARCALNYYRQAFRQGRRVLPDSPIEVPTLVLWGAGDPVLDRRMNAGLDAWVRDPRVRYIDDCGHWTQQECPEVVNAELLAWLGAHL